jgi:glycosyltransferase, family 28
MGTIIPVEDIGKLEEIIMDYDQIAAGMGHGMSGNNEKFCSGLEDIIHYIL